MDAPPRWSRTDPDTQTMDNVACSAMGEAVCRLFFCHVFLILTKEHLKKVSVSACVFRHVAGV